MSWLRWSGNDGIYGKRKERGIYQSIGKDGGEEERRGRHKVISAKGNKERTGNSSLG